MKHSVWQNPLHLRMIHILTNMYNSDTRNLFSFNVVSISCDPVEVPNIPVIYTLRFCYRIIHSVLQKHDLHELS